jgi:hypothetical protein
VTARFPLHKIVVLLCAVALSRRAFAQTSANDRSGPVLAAGIGYEYGLLGGQLLYQQRLGQTRIYIAPHVGVGWGPFEVPKIVYAGGVSAIWGKRHRAVLDFSYAMAGSLNVGLHGTTVDTIVVYAPTAGLGWEYVAESGFFLRVVPAGISLVMDRRVSPTDRRPYWNLSIGVGWKLW